MSLSIITGYMIYDIPYLYCSFILNGLMVLSVTQLRNYPLTTGFEPKEPKEPKELNELKKSNGGSDRRCDTPERFRYVLA